MLSSKSLPAAVWIGLLGISLPTTALGAPPAPAPAGAQVGAARPSAGQRAIHALGAWVRANGGQLSANAVELSSGASRGSYSEKVALNPASNMKVLTAAAVLAKLGPSYRFRTGLYGTRRGDKIEQLVLRGHGDPSLRVAELWRLASALADRGVKHVDAILVDQSRFDAEFIPPGFDQQPKEWAAFRAPISAVALERNTITLNVAPGETGKAARSWYAPKGFVRSDGSVQTRAAGSGQRVLWSLHPHIHLRSTLSGHIARGIGRVRFKKRVSDPRLYAGFVLKQLLEERGVPVHGVPVLGGANVKGRLSYVESARLGELVKELGKRSDNFYAETFFKVLGAETGTVPARSSDGARAIELWLRDIGAWHSGIIIKNGSGLFDTNRLSAHCITTVLRHAHNDARISPAFTAQLSVAGVDGTLRSRFPASRSSGQVRAKTGTLNRAIALSGYVLRPGSQQGIAFSFLVTGIGGQHAAIRSRIDRAVKALQSDVGALTSES